MLQQPVDRKRCASCERWRGSRSPGTLPDTVGIVSETASGLCENGGWHGSERRARSACGHWRIWSLLSTSPEDQ